MKKHCGQSAVFFDSGIGGLNLLHQCVLRLPYIHYYYISDNLNVPYGNKSGDEIFYLTMQSLAIIKDIMPAVLVVACNTVTAQCIDRLRAEFQFPVVGIQPAIKQAVKEGDRCAVLATQATLESLAFKNLLSLYGQHDIDLYACAQLAAFVEDNIFALPESLPKGLLPDMCADNVVLGCTHYAFIKKQIINRYNCRIFDGICGTANQFSKILGIDNHQSPPLGTEDHLASEKLNITFYGQNKHKNALIFEKLLHNKL